MTEKDVIKVVKIIERQARAVLMKDGVHTMVALVFKDGSVTDVIGLDAVLAESEKRFNEFDDKSGNEIRKIMWDSVHNLIKEKSANGIVVISETWVLAVKNNDFDGYLKSGIAPRHHPDRIECLNINWSFKAPDRVQGAIIIPMIRDDEKKLVSLGRSTLIPMVEFPEPGMTRDFFD